MENHQAGNPLECYGIPIYLKKEPVIDESGSQVLDKEAKPCYRCGFKIGGGIDQDPASSPQGYPDKGVYVTFVYEGGPAHRAGLQMHDKLLQVNGHDMTMVTHKKAVDYIMRKPELNMIVHRKGMQDMNNKAGPQPQFQKYPQGQQQFSRNPAFPGGPPPGSPQMQHQQYRPY